MASTDQESASGTLDWTGVIVFTSNQAGSVRCSTETSRIEHILTAHKKPFRRIAVDDPDNKGYKDEMQARSDTRMLPQVFVGGTFKGGFRAVDDANEDGEIGAFCTA
eukprot:TRINITY_DN32748_c0_g1_i1.p3 TRINITY_DN32748_c0_g1~~TRINITY_DN32748_c0_g1_i1.p3  ORF type:complete len:124 (+),score=8.36 TRINITY_DN32748_c0_g1_i1:53-373(+)